MKRKEYILAALLVVALVAFTANINKKTPSNITSDLSIGQAGKFALLAGSIFTNTRVTIVNENHGVNKGDYIVDPPNENIQGTNYINDEMTNPTKLYLWTIFNNSKRRNSKRLLSLAGNFMGFNLIPGLYKTTSSLEMKLGDQTVMFILELSIVSSAPGKKIILNGEKEIPNIFWHIDCSTSYLDTYISKEKFMDKE